MKVCEECGDEIRVKNQICWETGGRCYPEETYYPRSNRHVAVYKGRKYRVAGQGKTKYGQKTKLQFFNGSKEFWVDTSRLG